MFFNGVLSKYHPADAMTFLSQVGSDGVLSIADQECIITLTFKAGKLTDAQSAWGDRKILGFLRHDRRIDDLQTRKIRQIQSETGLSVRQILGKLNLFPLNDMKDFLQMSMLEVLRQLFLLDRGSFNFTETTVGDDGILFHMDAGKAALTVLPRADEYRDFLKTIQSADRRVRTNDIADTLKEATPAKKLVLKLAEQQLSINEIIAKAPLPSHEVAQHLQQFLSLGIITLRSANLASAPVAEPVLDPMFSAYKQALKTLLSSHDILHRLGAMVSFGKTYYDHMLIITARQGELIHCKTIRMDPARGLVQKSIKGKLGYVDEDPIFSTVCKSGIAFFGKTFPSRFLEQFIQQGPNGECALIPMLLESHLSIFLYATVAKNDTGLSPHHYLELLSWVLSPVPQLSISEQQAPNRAGHPQAILAENKTPAPSIERTAENQQRIKKMVSRIKDLPPLPTLVSKALQMLADPETPSEEIEEVIGQDQALVAKLIKVGNSALYGGLQKVTTLRQVLTRLGLKTTRNIVLTASTRSYFLKNRKGMRVWGQFLWQHSVESGLAARRIAETIHYPDPEEAFIGGLVHDIGKLIILMLFPELYKEILKVKKVNQMASKTSETRVIGSDHEQIGRLLMDQWNMPDSAKSCAEYHHRCRESETHSGLVAVVAYADYLSRKFGANPESLLADDQAYAQDAAAILKITDAAQAALAEAVLEDFQHAEMMME
jgi:HD-like signal output (HDOD) protein